MNGKHRQVVIETDLGMPIGLTLDIPANRLYWIDQEFGFNTGNCLIEVTTWAGLTVYNPVVKGQLDH
jgi:hypothetical protein